MDTIKRLLYFFSNYSGNSKFLLLTILLIVIFIPLLFLSIQKNKTQVKSVHTIAIPKNHPKINHAIALPTTTALLNRVPIKAITKLSKLSKISKYISPTIQNTPIQMNTPIINPSNTIMPKTNKLIFGVGPEADKALQTRLVKETPVKMLTSWYNGPNDLPWITEWKNVFIPGLYANGYTLHLITFTDFPEVNITTKYGPACGREYPVSERFSEDMKQLAQVFSGNGPLYVTLFTEFQTYPCIDNTWKENENYYNALKDNYRAALNIFHQYAPNAKVGISWGGWQARWDNPEKTEGRSLFKYFDDILKDSDITAFQAMQSDTNASDIESMTQILSAYNKPIILSHYKPDNGSQQTFDNDIHYIFTDSIIENITKKGLTAISFMDTNNIENEDTFQFIKTAIQKYSQ